jgi:hypothetical protein
MILFLSHRFARTFFQSVPVILWHRAVSMPVLAPNAHFLPDAKTPLGHHATGAIPTLCLIQKTGIPDHRRVRWPTHRPGQQWRDVPQQRIIVRQTDGLYPTDSYFSTSNGT